MLVDFSGLCCGFVVWVGGTVAVHVAARRYQAAHADRVHPIATLFATGVASVALLLVGVGIVALADLLPGLFKKMGG